jgi:phenylacetate-coenzyme A ligase PaaK-like adenylate-forming protein
VRLVDELRGRYAHAPRWAQRAVGTALSVVPPELLYGGTYRRLQVDIERSEWDAAFVEERTRAQLAALIGAARRTRFYGERLAGLPAGTPTLADLATLPVLTKEEVRHRADDMLAAPRSTMDEVMTGGTSTGVALSFYLDKDRSVKEWAYLTHLWQRVGYRPGDRLAVLGYRGVTQIERPTQKPWAWEPGTRELRLSPLRMVPAVMDEYLALVTRYKVAFFYGYPSALSILAGHARNRGWTPPPTLRGVLLMSEAIRPFQREAMREGFGPIPLLSCYGLSEKVAIAGEVPGSPGEYEFEPLYGWTELVDAAGLPVTTPGDQGTLVGTGFVSMGMPLIRYDTGDLATAVTTPSAENRWRLRVRDIVSCYWQEYLVTREGGLVTPIVLYPNNRVAREFQFVQHEPGRAVLRLVLEEGVGRAETDGLVREVNRRADGTMDVTAEVVDGIAPTSRGKRVMVEQHLDLAPFGMTPQDDADATS